MELREYLFRERKTIVAFAKECDYSTRYISGCIKKEFKPSKKFIKIIEHVTNGKVTKEDWNE